MTTSRALSDSQWQDKLTLEQYHVLRKAATERPFSHAYVTLEDPGYYDCVGCGARLFLSETKFDAGCGWPSFFESQPGAISEHEDTSHGRVRTEIRCATCEGHLGHVFTDGPAPTGLRYCLNGTALQFVPLV